MRSGLIETASEVCSLSHWERGGVRGSGLSKVQPLTRIALDDASHRQEQSDLSPLGRGEWHSWMGRFQLRLISRYAAYTDDFGSGNIASWVLILSGQTTEMCSPAFCITTGVERSF